MTKIGLTRPSARRKEPTPDEQTRLLLEYGVAAENIHQSVEAVLTEMVLALNDEAALGGEIEIVVSSLSRLGPKIRDLLEKLDAINFGEAKLTVLGPEYQSQSIQQWRITVRNIADMFFEDIAEKKKDAAAAARERKVPIGPTPKLSTRDVEWIWEQAESSGWGPNRLAKELRRERNISVSYKTVLRVLGRDKGRKPYVPRDNHKFLKRDDERRG
ncbi:helix-turn-helix domain-containing protein [Microbacterium sp. UCD-TDU]|uniref:helix-turn-helix domain-containing protein n=1 Tax=Microbacterium sp. UCD-TDU TaxID=1247714 RepID=UPI0003706C68|nr:helix-turn-helix domain-containing protein [Microbacterium sp. UCD-TDU]EYT60880.1 hypothetical protein D514_0104205 [Microbacterium sp. UCD-TDU]